MCLSPCSTVEATLVFISRRRTYTLTFLVQIIVSWNRFARSLREAVEFYTENKQVKKQNVWAFIIVHPVFTENIQSVPVACVLYT